MKILHAIACGSPNSGIPVVLRALAEEQNKIDGVEARVISFRCDVKTLGSPYFQNLKVEDIDGYLKDYRPDVLLLHTVYYYQYVVLARKAKKHNIPFIVEPHGSFGYQAMHNSFLKKKLANISLFRSILRDSIGYIYTNNGEYHDSVMAKRSLIVPNGVIVDDVHNAAPKESVCRDNLTFYFLGRFDIHHKGLDYLLEALKILDERGETVKFDFYGTGSAEDIEFLNKSINGFRCVRASNRGTVFGAEKKKSLEMSNILVLTSRYEGSPMTILDSLSYGNPCVVTPGTNMAEEITANGLGWKTVLNSQDIAETIIMAREDYLSNYDTFFRRCQKYVLDNYDWKTIASKSIGAYELLMNKKN